MQLSRDVCNSSRDVTTVILHCFAWRNVFIARFNTVIARWECSYSTMLHVKQSRYRAMYHSHRAMYQSHRAMYHSHRAMWPTSCTMWSSPILKQTAYHNSHPICKSQNLTNYPTWYSGGPLVSYIPLPIPDPSRPWGRTNCDECKRLCYGHFLKPSEALKSTLTPMASPPSTAIKEKLTVYPPPDHELVCNEVAKHVLLSSDQTWMWFEHLHTVRENWKRGVARAAATKRISKRKKCLNSLLCISVLFYEHYYIIYKFVFVYAQLSCYCIKTYWLFNTKHKMLQMS